MKKYISLLFLLAASLPAFSQHFDWVKSYSGQEPLGELWNYIVSSMTDSHGNLYVAGQFANGASIDGQDLKKKLKNKDLMLYLTDFSTASRMLNFNNPTQGCGVATIGSNPDFCSVGPTKPLLHSVPKGRNIEMGWQKSVICYIRAIHDNSW